MTTAGGSDHQTNHYENLGVCPTSSLEEIKAAHRRLALRLHPDKRRQQNHSTTDVLPQEAREEEFKRVQAAWECLSDPQRKHHYDEDLKRRQDRNRARRQAATAIRLSEMEACIAEEDGTCGYAHPCRCGEFVELWQQNLLPDEHVFLECPSCSLGFCVINDVIKK